MFKARILFAEKSSGTLEVKYGRLSSPPKFKNETELTVEVSDANLEIGSRPTVVSVLREKNPFTFLARDVSKECPVWSREFAAAVLPADDPRTYAQTVFDIESKGLVSDFDRMNAEPEETYEAACVRNRDQLCPVWLGLGGDARMFHIAPQSVCQVGGHDFQYYGKILAYDHSRARIVKLKNGQDHLDTLLFEIGPGAHCAPKLSRSLDEGCLPIYHASQDEQTVRYDITAFATLESGPVSEKSVRGTDWREALMHAGLNNTTPEEKAEWGKNYLRHSMEDLMLCVVRVEAANVSAMPAYAWFKAPHSEAVENKFENGISSSAYYDGKALAVSRLNGAPLKESETAVLVPPGGKAVFEIIAFHTPVDAARAKKIFRLDYDSHLAAARKFWHSRLDTAAKIHVPEKAIDDRIRAGLLHLEINTLGKTSGETPLLPCVGWYAPIGTESAPMIQFYDSMGLHDIARRCCGVFLERQRGDGFINCYFNYQSETGAFLWSAGEHYLYTHDLAWLRKVTPKLVRSCDFLLRWREKNKTEEFRRNGCYGLLSGKVADPEDYYHSFFLNAGTYIGLKRMALVLADTDPVYAEKLRKEVELYRKDIVHSVAYAQARAPLLPRGDGSWSPELPSWVEYVGSTSYYVDGGEWFSHGCFSARSSLTGPLYLAVSEVFDPMDEAITLMLKANQHPVTRENAAISQPYYCRHDYAHLMRGEVKLFLKTYYNQMTALQDRQSLTFWEHYFNVSEHKTHEEAWFLMQTRWMLFVEDGNSLDLFRCVPRRWLEEGKSIVLENVHTHFGKLNAKAEAHGEQIVCEFESERAPESVRIRLPHPEGRRAVSCEGGTYDPSSETVTVSGRKGKVVLKF